MVTSTSLIDSFLQPFETGPSRVEELAREFALVFKELSANSHDQFLATPISESMLRPDTGGTSGRWVIPR